MNRLPTLTAGLLASCLLAGCEGEETLTEADVAAIRRIGQEHTQATLAADWDRLLAMRTDDIVWMPPNAAPVEGKAAVRQFLEAGPRATAFTITSVRTEGSDDLAYDRGTYVYSNVVGRDTVTDAGKYLVIFRHQEDDTWLVAAEMWSSNSAPVVPAATPPRRRTRA